MLTVFWDIKEPITIDFLEKVAAQMVLTIANPLGKMHLIYRMTYIKL